MEDQHLTLPAGLKPFGYPALFDQLREGFFYTPLEENKDAFRFTALADANRVGQIFQAYSRLLPEEAFFILEYYTLDVASIDWSRQETSTPCITYSPYLPTPVLMETLLPVLPRLIHDGFVGFGIANSREGMELFYSEEKVLTFFSGNHLQISNFLQQQGLPYSPELNLPTDYEHEHLSLLNLNRRHLPEELTKLSPRDLDYRHYCNELVEQLDMYQVNEGPSFFLTKKEQDQIENYIRSQSHFSEFWEEEFGNLLLDWIDFVEECHSSFDGDLWEYRQALRLRDLIQAVAAGVPNNLSDKLLEIVREADSRFRSLLIDSHKRLDSSGEGPDRFWHQGMIRNPGSVLRRDLIRQGWYKH